MSIDTQRILVEMTKNYNRMINQMIAKCGGSCLKIMEIGDLTASENRCVENCIHKYFKTYQIGEKFTNYITYRMNEDRAYKSSDIVDIISDAERNINI